MKLFGYTISKKKDTTEPKTDLDSDELAEMRRFKAEERKEEMRMRREERQMELDERKIMHAERMQQFQERLYGSVDDDIGDDDIVNKTIMTVLSSIAQRQVTTPNPVAMTTSPPVESSSVGTLKPDATGVTITDAQLEEYWNSLSFFKKKMAKSMSKEQLTALLRGQVKGVTDDSIERAYKLIQSK